MDRRGRKFVERGGRLIRLEYEKWRERLRKGMALRFSVKSREDRRSALGRRIDTAGFYFLLWVATLFLLSRAAGSFKTAVLFSVPVLALEALIIRKIRRSLTGQAGRCAAMPPVPPGGGAGAGAEKGRISLLAALKQAAFNSRKKARHYFAAAIVMYAGHLFLRDSGFLSGLYLAFALINTGLGLVCLVRGGEGAALEAAEGKTEEE
ncbi:MAG: hypothetical protein K6T80_04490 [Firmicutes bacterium]|nr:hypothetical protein [Bacillota bacterium]